jgi:hypothetical protein
MTTREITIAFEFAIGVFALYLLIRRLARLGARDQETPPFYVAEIPDDALRNADELVTIAWFKMAEEAQMWAAILREEGIEASVPDATVEGGRYVGLRDSASPHIEVLAKHARRAAEILREGESRRG